MTDIGETRSLLLLARFALLAIIEIADMATAQRLIVDASHGLKSAEPEIIHRARRSRYETPGGSTASWKSPVGFWRSDPVRGLAVRANATAGQPKGLRLAANLQRLSYFSFLKDSLSLVR
jgi:hypothetical protein